MRTDGRCARDAPRYAARGSTGIGCRPPCRTRGVHRPRLSFGHARGPAGRGRLRRPGHLVPHAAGDPANPARTPKDTSGPRIQQVGTPYKAWSFGKILPAAQGAVRRVCALLASELRGPPRLSECHRTAGCCAWRARYHTSRACPALAKLPPPPTPSRVREPLLSKPGTGPTFFMHGWLQYTL